MLLAQVAMTYLKRLEPARLGVDVVVLVVLPKVVVGVFTTRYSVGYRKLLLFDFT